MRHTLAVLVLLSALASPAFADRAKAREFFIRGKADFVLERWDDAIADFEAGYREESAPAFLFNIAQAHRKAHRPAESIHFFQKLLQVAPDTPDRADAEKAIAELEAELKSPAGQIPSKPTMDARPGPAVHVADGPPTAAPAPPSDAPAPARLVESPPERAPETPTRRSRWPLWVGLGAVGVAAVAGITLGVAFLTPSDQSIPSTSLGNIHASFP